MRSIVPGIADENVDLGQRPKALDDGRMGVVTAGNEGQPAVLDVRYDAVGQDIPLRAQPDRRDVALSPMESRGEVVEHGHRAAGSDRAHVMGAAGRLLQS